ncbi:MAG: inositol monophosphatase family protein [Actinomycetota bacterium]
MEERLNPFDVEQRRAEMVAARARDLLMSFRLDAWPIRDMSAFRRNADQLANRFVISELARYFPLDAVLSEEEPDRVADRIASRRVWIVDPLDGTWNFAEGRDDWAVQIALVVHGDPVVGAIALPSNEEAIGTRGRFVTRGRQGPLRIVVSRSRPPRWWTGFPAEAEIVAMGSVGAKVAAVIAGDADAYLHDEGMREWDAAAPVAVAIAKGLHASRLDGGALVFNSAIPILDDLLITRPELADRLFRPVERIEGGRQRAAQVS